MKFRMKFHIMYELGFLHHSRRESQSLKAFKNLCNEDKGLTNLNFEFDILVCSKANLVSLGWEESGARPQAKPGWGYYVKYFMFVSILNLITSRSDARVHS